MVINSIACPFLEIIRCIDLRLKFRYQREEAKIQAWVNLQSAKAEAESRKLEVLLK